MFSRTKKSLYDFKYSFASIFNYYRYYVIHST